MTFLIHYENNRNSLHNSEWQGSKPQKFKGGRRHNNHPLDQLDNLLIGSSPPSRLLGPTKKRFQQVITIGTDQPPRPHIRTNIDRTHSNVVFDCQNISKLIKIPYEKNQNIQQNHEVNKKKDNFGQSKIKRLQKGQLKTGIYRNFYKSSLGNQFK